MTDNFRGDLGPFDQRFADADPFATAQEQDAIQDDLLAFLLGELLHGDHVAGRYPVLLATAFHYRIHEAQSSLPRLAGFRYHRGRLRAMHVHRSGPAESLRP